MLTLLRHSGLSRSGDEKAFRPVVYFGLAFISAWDLPRIPQLSDNVSCFRTVGIDYHIRVHLMARWWYIFAGKKCCCASTRFCACACLLLICILSRHLFGTAFEMDGDSFEMECVFPLQQMRVGMNASLLIFSAPHSPFPCISCCWCDGACTCEVNLVALDFGIRKKASNVRLLYASTI